MREKHPFGNFVPPCPKYLLLGSFTTKPIAGYEWFYANGRNQFWPILEEVYGLELKTKSQQRDLFIELKMALADIILECERVNNSNLDINLKDLVFNRSVGDVIKATAIGKVYFTSRFVEKLFRREFKNLIQEIGNLELVTLPSPSPRYARLTKNQKVAVYTKLLPKLSDILIK